MRVCLVGLELGVFDAWERQGDLELHALVPHSDTTALRQPVTIHRFNHRPTVWPEHYGQTYPPPWAYRCDAHSESMATLLALIELEQRLGAFDRIVFDAQLGWAHCALQHKRTARGFAGTTLAVFVPPWPPQTRGGDVAGSEIKRQALRYAEAIDGTRQSRRAYRDAFALEWWWGRVPSWKRRARPGRVSAVITNYNLGPWLPVAVESVRAAHEIIVVDDASTDDAAVLAQLERTGVRVVRRARNGGPSAARNDGIAAAVGDYVLLLDGDDVLVPGFIESAKRALDQDAALAAIIATVGYFDDGEVATHQAHKAHATYLGDTVALNLRENAIGGCTSLTRRKVLRRTPFDSTLDGVEDWHLWLRLALAGQQIAVTNEVQVHYRQRPDSLSKRRLATGGREALRQRMLAALPPLPRAARYLALG